MSVWWSCGDRCNCGRPGHAVIARSGYLDGDGAAPAVNKSGVYVSTGCQTQIKLSLSGQTLWDHAARGPGGGGQYSGAPSDIGIGNNVLVVPTGSTVTAFG